MSKAAGATCGEFVSPEEFRAKMRSIGRIPAERTTTYKIRRTFESEADAHPVDARLPTLGAQHHAAYTEGAY
jgi:FO synthase subunit 2